MIYSCSTANVYAGKAIALWLVCQWASIHFEHSRNELALAEFTMLCSWTRHLTLTMPHSINNIKFGGLGGTHTCKDKTLVYNCEDYFHFHRFCFIYLLIYLLPIHSTTLQANKQTLLWRRRQPKAQMRHTRDAPDYLNIRKIYTNRNVKVLVILM